MKEALKDSPTKKAMAQPFHKPGYSGCLLLSLISSQAVPVNLSFSSLPVAVLVNPTSSDFLRSPDFSCATLLSRFQ
jgi:hypothetical protein